MTHIQASAVSPLVWFYLVGKILLVNAWYKVLLGNFLCYMSTKPTYQTIQIRNEECRNGYMFFQIEGEIFN